MNITPVSHKPPRRGARRAPRGSLSGGLVLNAALFAVLAAALVLCVAVSFPAIRAALNIDAMLGVLPSSPAILTTGARVTEIMPSNSRTLPDETGSFSDWIELSNLGGEPVNLKGYTLSDRDEPAKFVFPDITLEPGACVVVFASGAESALPDKPLHAAMKLSASGETLYFRDDTGGLIEAITIPASRPDESYARTGSRWSKTSSPTPGYENTQAGRDAFVSSTSPQRSGLQLNELMASNAATIADEDGEYSDWIELFNASAIAVDLSRYALSDDPDRPVKWRFPDGASIEPYGVYLLFASGKSRPDSDRPHASFRLRADHGVVILSDLAGGVVDITEYDNLPTDAAWARRRNADPWEIGARPSPGSLNP